MDIAESRDIVSAITTATADDDTMAVPAKEVSADAGVEAASPKSCSGDLPDAASPSIDKFTNFASLSPGPTEIDEEAVKATETTLLGLGLISAGQIRKLRALAQREAIDSIPNRVTSEVGAIINIFADGDDGDEFLWRFPARSFIGLDAHTQCELICSLGVSAKDVVAVLKRVRNDLLRDEENEGTSATEFYERSLSTILRIYKSVDELEPRMHRLDPVYTALSYSSTPREALSWLSAAFRSVRWDGDSSGVALARKLVSELTGCFSQVHLDIPSLISAGQERAFLEISGDAVSFKQAVSRLRRLSQRNGHISSVDLAACAKDMGFPETVSVLRLTHAPIACFAARNTVIGEMELSFWVAFPVEDYSPLPEAASLQKAYYNHISDLHIITFRSVLFNYGNDNNVRYDDPKSEALRNIHSGLRSLMNTTRTGRCVYSVPEHATHTG